MAKKLFIAALIGAGLGSAAFAWVGMRVTEWYFDPGPGAPFSCTTQIHTALVRVAIWQAVGAGIGLVTLPLLAFLVARRRQHHPGSSGQAQEPAR